MKNKIYLLFSGLKLHMQQMNSFACLISWFIKCITICKSPEVNWLKISDVVRVTKIDHQFILHRPGTNYTGGLKQTFVNMVMYNYTALGVCLLYKYFIQFAKAKYFFASDLFASDDALIGNGSRES